MDETIVRKIEEKAAAIRANIVRMIGVGKTGHLGGSSSSAEIIATLYFHEMNIDPRKPKAPERDRFLLSKGHAALAQYAALAEHGFFPKEEMERVKTLHGMLQGHPDMKKTPGVEANTGSLGQGLSIALGMALGLRLDGGPQRVFVILGDGELAEGQIWEAAMAAANFKADNLVAFLDRNRLQATGAVSARFDTNPLREKWEAFGWDVQEIDGHDVRAILSAIDRTREVSGKPSLIIANTIKGKGFSFAENRVEFHNGSMTKDQFDLALRELRK